MTNYTWDADNRPLSLSNTTVTGSVLDSETYVRDWLGNITSQTDSSGVTNFVYDADYRLTSATYPNSAYSQSFTYDKVGNRLTMTKGGGTPLYYSYDVDNRLTQINLGSTTGALQNSFVYDNDNNLITKKDGSGNTLQTLAYDPEGRAVTITTSGIGINTTLSYDPMDYRIAKTDSQGTLTYLLEGERIDAIMNGSQFQADYMRGSVVDEVVNGFQYDPSGNWTNYTFHHDMLQSVVGLSSHDGSILQTVSYDPFGSIITNIGVGSNNSLLYTGREQDPDSGLYYYRARYYDPSIGRFTSEDPLGFKAGVNFYAYAQNNPINANDPYGLTWQSDLLGFTSAGLNTAALATVWDPPVAFGLKIAGGAVSFLTIGNAYYEYRTGQISSTQFDITAGIEAVNFAGGFAAKPVEALVTGITRGVGIANTAVSTVQDIGAAQGQSDSAAAGGFLIYPNKPNTNMMQAVYKK